MRIPLKPQPGYKASLLLQRDALCPFVVWPQFHHQIHTASVTRDSFCIFLSFIVMILKFVHAVDIAGIFFLYNCSVVLNLDPTGVSSLGSLWIRLL